MWSNPHLIGVRVRVRIKVRVRATARVRVSVRIRVRVRFRVTVRTQLGWRKHGRLRVKQPREWKCSQVRVS